MFLCGCFVSLTNLYPPKSNSWLRPCSEVYHQFSFAQLCSFSFKKITLMNVILKRKDQWRLSVTTKTVGTISGTVACEAFSTTGLIFGQISCAGIRELSEVRSRSVEFFTLNRRAYFPGSWFVNIDCAYVTDDKLQLYRTIGLGYTGGACGNLQQKARRISAHWVLTYVYA